MPNPYASRLRRSPTFLPPQIILKPANDGGLCLLLPAPSSTALPGQPKPTVYQLVRLAAYPFAHFSALPSHLYPVRRVASSLAHFQCPQIRTPSQTTLNPSDSSFTVLLFHRPKPVLRTTSHFARSEKFLYPVQMKCQNYVTPCTLVTNYLKICRSMTSIWALNLVGMLRRQRSRLIQFPTNMFNDDHSSVQYTYYKPQ